MLVLTRKTQQQIQIGPHITITILKVKGQAVRVGIEAPREVCVLRAEVAEKLARENPATAAPAANPTRRRSPQASTHEVPAFAGLEGAIRRLRCRIPRAESSPLTTQHERAGSASPSSAARTTSRRLLAL